MKITELVDRPTLLLVDDEDDLRVAIRRVFAGEDYRVLEASGPAEALAILSTEPVDAIISDFHMPTVNGLDFLQRVRLSYPRVLRLMLTGNRDVAVAARALNEGCADRYILKPWDSSSLRELVRIALTTHGARRALTAPDRARDPGELRAPGDAAI